MADDVPTSDGPLRESDALDVAIQQARAELDAMMQAASAADSQGVVAPDYTLHEVMGVGRYAVPRRNGWMPLIDIIHNPGANIDFSRRDYPIFDDVLDTHFDATQLSDPLDDDYEKWAPLRDNIAAVRNFLMMTYYTNTPAGMTPQKARESLQQIASYVGDGLHNNHVFLGLVPNHDPRKPFISISEAMRPDGQGAQYLYEKILEMQRHSNWMKPFAPIIAMFGGKNTHDWMLPSGFSTPFNALYQRQVVTSAGGFSKADFDAAMQRLDQLEARRAQLRQSTELTMMAVDLDAMGNQLLFTADNMNRVETLSEPVQRSAIEEAKKILRGLKISIGDLNILEGLRLKPKDDLNALGSVTGVAQVYQKLLAWGRGIDPSILNHPSIVAATQAIGQLGYLAKLEAMRVAQAAGNPVLAGKIATQLKMIPQHFAQASEQQFGGLLDRVERGIDTVLNRIQEINAPGAMVGHLPMKDRGSYMSGTPIAGQAMQLSADGANTRDDRNAAILEAQDMAERAAAQRVQARSAAQSQQQGNAQQARSTSRSASGRQALQQARATAQRSSTSFTPAGVNAQQIRAMQIRNALFAAQHAHDEEDPHAHGHTNQDALHQILTQAQMNQIRSATSMNGVTGMPVATGRASYDTMMRNTAVAQKSAVQTNAKQQYNKTEDNIHQNELRQEAQIHTTPPGKGGGRGF